MNPQPTATEYPTSDPDGASDQAAPVPVIVVERVHDHYLGVDDDEYLMTVSIGGVRLMTRTYTADPAFSGQRHHVENLTEAQEKILEAFGERMANLIGETGW